MAATQGHLVGAYGLFWKREHVNWNPQRGNTWQLLGARHFRPPALRVCDFRLAKGVYVLYDEYGPRYTGLARGSGGLGQRLKQHDKAAPREIVWTRFSWFAFDDIADIGEEHPGWSELRERREVVPNQEATIREIEALMIQILGTTQNQMRFQQAKQWDQLQDFEAANMKNRQTVDPTLFTERPWDDPLLD